MSVNKHRLSFGEAEQLAIKAAAFITEDKSRLERFLSLTGWTPEALKQDAERTAFLAATLDHLAGDESLLLTFASNSGTDPTLVGHALRIIENS